ncbi:MAG: glycosyltransferase N-terminal domain-containing protein [Candidatus Omnitrophota bacterium]
MSEILFLIYDVIFCLGLIGYLPMHLWRKKMTARALKEKLGLIGPSEKRKSIWIQAVSVGEANLIGNLLKRLKEAHDCPIIISTTTLTGNRIARKRYSHLAKIIFFPFDISIVLEQALKVIKPKIFIAVETEIWPNLFYRLNKRSIPIVIINGRISDAAFKRYRLIRPLMKKVLKECNYIGVQNLLYKERFLFLGADPNKIVVSGNMKFESIFVNEEALRDKKEHYIPILKKGGNQLLIAASTHEPEEEIIVDIYKDVFKELGGVTLLIAPRHPERTPQIEKIIRLAGFNPVKMSEVRENLEDRRSVFIADTIGELLYFYSIADICFVGGSLSNNGGHNILEPVYFRKPTIFGPNMDNFPDVEEIVLAKGAGIKVRNREELGEILLSLVNDTALKNNLHNRCNEVFKGEKKSLENNLAIISKCLA